jgi:ATP-binding cassette subfamily C protein
MQLLRKIAYLVVGTRRDLRNVVLLFLMMVVAAALEALGVGLVFPFVALIQNPRVVDESRALQIVRDMSGAQTDAGLVTAFGAGLLGAFVLKNAYLAFSQWVQFRFTAARHLTLSRQLVERYFANDYTFHLQHNSSELIQNVIYDIHLVINQVLVSGLVVAVEGLTVLVILGAMVALEPILVPVVGAGIGIVAFTFYRTLQRKSVRLGAEEKAFLADMIKWVQQGLGGIKEAQVIGVERFFLNAFTRSASGFGRVGQQHQFMQLVPRYLLESLGVLALVAVSLGMLARGRSGQAVLPVLGVLAVAAVRILPSVARILAGLTSIRHNTAPVDGLYAAMTAPGRYRELPKGPPRALGFERELRLKDVEYRYPGAPQPSLRNVSLTIARGESIAFVGASGAGKTTMVDLLIGLLEPTAGHLEVDGEPLVGDQLIAWRRKVGYIPQQVYLCDDSVLRNVAFGLEDSEIDRARVESVVDSARLRDVVASLPDGLDTFVGERGVRLSGGQRQRIGIARALYLDPRVLVLDEATSSLDGKTEQEIVDAIEQVRAGRTLMVIAHRLSTVRRCDRVVFLKDGEVVQIGSWDELCEANSDFRHLVKLADTDGRAELVGASP